MPTTLVTGATGFVGATVVDELIKASHNVVVSVRSESSFNKLLSIHPEWQSQSTKITLAAVPDFTAPGAFDAVFQSHPEIDYIAHIAAPVLDNPANTDFVEHFERPSVLGNTGLLKSAKQYGQNVKSVVVTGSVNSITTGDQEDLKKRVLSSDQWLPIGREDAIKMQNSYISYCVGKKLADQALWSFVKEEKPAFSITNFVPPLIFGPMLQNVPSPDKINFSLGLVRDMINSGDGKVPNTPFSAYIDVRDLAALHIKALTTPAAANRRLIVGHPMTFDKLAASLRKVPELKGRIGSDNEEDIVQARLDTKDTDSIFGVTEGKWKYRTLDQTITDAAMSVLEVEKKAKQ